MNTVYALTDPRTNAIRYVGITKHLTNRITNHRCTSSNKRLAAWKDELRSEEREISFVVLESGISNELATDAEKRWIAKAKSDGCDLLNVHEGGKPTRCAGKPKFINLRDIPPELHLAVKLKAIGKGMSMQEYILATMAREVKQ